MKWFLSLLSLVIIAQYQVLTEAQRTDYYTIIVKGYMSPTCREKGRLKMCLYVDKSEIGKCDHVMMRSWHHISGGMQVTSYWDPLCKNPQTTISYVRGCRRSYENYETVEILNNFPCYNNNYALEEDINNSTNIHNQNVNVITFLTIMWIIITIILVLIVVYGVWIAIQFFRNRNNETGYLVVP
jgi:hypothetical protein